MYKCIEPEVAGELANGTIIDTSVHPPLIKKLHFQFMGWLGDDLLETFPCFIVTERLQHAIRAEKLTGIIFDDVKITFSKEYQIMYEKKEIPKFYWMKITGKIDMDDFAIAKDLRLLISHKALAVLTTFNIKNATIQDYLIT